MSNNLEIKYQLTEEQKERIIRRCREVLDRTEGPQAVIVLDKEGMMNYYQNVCLTSLLESIRASAE